MSPRETIKLPGFKHTNPIPAARRAGPLLMTSVIDGVDPDTGELGKTLDEQCRFMFECVRRIVTAAGGSVRDIVKMTVWMQDVSDRTALNREWLALFPDEHARPARHTQRGLMRSELLIQCDFTAWVE